MSPSDEKRSSLKRGLSKRADKVRNLFKRIGGSSADRRNNVESSLSAASPKANSTSDLGYYRTSLDESEQHNSRSRTVSSGAARLSAEGQANSHRLRHHGVFAGKQSGTFAGPSPPISPTISHHSKRTSTTSTSTYSLGPRSNGTSVDDLAIGCNSVTSLPSSSTSSSLSSREYRSCEETDDSKETHNNRNGAVRVMHSRQETTPLKERPLREKEENERTKKEQHHNHHQPLPLPANVVLGTEDEPKRFLSLKDKQEVVLPSIEEKLEHLEHDEGGAKIKEGLASVEIKLQEQLLPKTNTAVDDVAKEELSRNVSLTSKEQDQQQEFPPSQEGGHLLPAPEKESSIKNPPTLHDKKMELSSVPPPSAESCSLEITPAQQQSLLLIGKAIKQDLHQEAPPTELAKPIPFVIRDVQSTEPTFSSAIDKSSSPVEKDSHELPPSSVKKDEQMATEQPAVPQKDKTVQLPANKDDPIQPQGAFSPSSESLDATASAIVQYSKENENSDKHPQRDIDEQDDKPPTIIVTFTSKDTNGDIAMSYTDEQEKEDSTATIIEERQLVLRTPPLSEAMSKRVAYFDKERRGKITVLDTYASLRGLGYYWIVAIPATFIMHLRLSPLTAPAYAGIKDFLCLPIYTDRVAQALQAPEGPLVAQRELMPTWVQLYGQHHGTAGVCGLGFWGGFRALRAAERTYQLQWWQIRLWMVHRLQWILTYTVLYDPSVRMVTQPALEGLCNQALLAASSDS